MRVCPAQASGAQRHLELFLSAEEVALGSVPDWKTLRLLAQPQLHAGLGQAKGLTSPFMADAGHGKGCAPGQARTDPHFEHLVTCRSQLCLSG